MGNTASSSVEFARAIKQLETTDVQIDDHVMWRGVFTSTLTFNDIYNTINTASIRVMRGFKPCNLAAFIFKCIEQVALFASQKSTPAKISKADTVAVSSALALLSRLVPLALEEFNPQLLPRPAGSGPAPDAPPFSRYAEHFGDYLFWQNLQCVEADESLRFPVASGFLGSLLMESLCALTVVPGYTIGARQTAAGDPPATHPLVEPGFLWASGIAADPKLPISFDDTINHNRVQVVKCIIACLSAQPLHKDPFAPDGLRQAVTDSRCPHASTLVVSLINFAGNYYPYGVIPYTSHWVNNSEELVVRCVQLLSLLLDPSVFYVKATGAASAAIPAAPAAVPAAVPPTSDAAAAESSISASPLLLEGGVQDEAAPAAATGSAPAAAAPVSSPGAGDALPDPSAMEVHAAWSILAHLSDADGAFLRRGVEILLSVAAYSKQTYLPGSQRSFTGTEELLVLVWKLLDWCPAYRKNLFARASGAAATQAGGLAGVPVTHATALVVPICDYIMTSAADGKREAAVNFGVTLMMKLSVERDFAVSMNAPFLERLPFNVQHFTGTYFDLVVLVMHSILVSGSKMQSLVSSQPTAIAVINNLTPFATSVSSIASAKLTNLLLAYATPVWLSQQPYHAMMLNSLILVLASLLQYQYRGSVNVLYSLVRNADAVRKLWKGMCERTLPLPEEVLRNTQAFTLICAIDAVEADVKSMVGLDPNADVQGFLTSATLVGKLPVPHPIVVNRYSPKRDLDVWVTAWLWSNLYSHFYPPFLDVDSVKIFGLRH